jgi:hypothetical protein
VIAYISFVSLMMYWAASPLFLRHHDLGWHLAAGDLIRAQGIVPSTDPWSFTAQGYPWLNISWLWDVVASWLYSLGGFGALMVFTILIGVGISTLLALINLRSGSYIVLTSLAVLWVALALPLYECPADYVLSIAPQAISLLFFMLFWNVLDAVSRGRRARLLWALPFLTGLWANMHGGFLLAFVLLAAYILEAIVRRQTTWLQQLLLTALGCAAFIMINPLGIHVIDGTLRTLGGVAKGSITEWQPFAFGKDFISSLYLLMFVLFANWQTVNVRLAHRLLAVFFLVMGLGQQRNFGYFMLTSLPLLLNGLHQWFDNYSARYQMMEARCQTDCVIPSLKKKIFVLMVLAFIALVPMTLSRWPRDTRFPDDIAPLEEIAYVKENFPGEKLFNHWNFGGFIIFETRGAIPVLVDGRAETAYPSDLLSLYHTYGSEKEIIDRYKLRVAMMPRYSPANLIYFDTSPEWKLAFSGKVANVYVRKTKK